MKYDVIIIGGGAAGLSAALWCDDLKLDSILFEAAAELGGQLLWTYNPIKNHLGAEAESGREMRDKFVEQIENRKFLLKLDSKIAQIDAADKTVFLKSGEKFAARSIIIASGIRRRKLNIGEEKFREKGIIESGKRDADAVKNKNVCVIGGGDAALENALILADAAAKVFLIHRRREFRARREFVEQIINHSKIEILTETIVKKMFGDEKITAVELENLKTKGKITLAVEAILIRIGVEPNTKLLGGKIELDANGYIKTNQNCETNLSGIFAVGDVANPLAPTVSSAVGTGATAVKTILAQLRS